jgi:hypothetical protein
LDWAIGVLAGYGTDNERIGWSSAIIICLFAVFYATSGKFEIKEEKTIPCEIKTTSISDNIFGYDLSSDFFKIDCKKIDTSQSSDITTLTIPQAITEASKAVGISVDNYLPFKIPSTQEYQPTDLLTSALSGIEKFLGWILIPLFIANLGGFLQNKANPTSKSGGDD